MSTTHIIVGGIVVNTIVATVAEAQAAYPDAICIDASTGGAIGWSYDGQMLAPPLAPPAPAPAVPQSVSRAQGKAALIAAGLWPAVLAYVAAIADPTDKALAEVALNDTQEWRRDSLFLNSAASALGLTGAQLDQLFVDASGIVF